MSLWHALILVAAVCSVVRAGADVEIETSYSCENITGYVEIPAVVDKCYHMGPLVTMTWYEAYLYCIQHEGFLATPADYEKLMGIDAWIKLAYPSIYHPDAPQIRISTGFWTGFKRRPMPVGDLNYIDDVRPHRINGTNFSDIYEFCDLENKEMPDIWAKTQPDDTPPSESEADEMCVAKRRIGHSKWTNKDKGTHDWDCAVPSHYAVCERCADIVIITPEEPVDGPE